MSDFITELRREVVSAHAAHGRSAARTRRRRWRPVLAGAVALAALVVAVVLIARSIPAPERTSEPRVLKVLRIGGDPTDGTFAAGSLWVTDMRGRRVLRIDPRSRKLVGQVALEDGADEVAGDESSVWVRGEAIDRAGGVASQMWRIDPGSDRVVAGSDRGYRTALAMSGGAAWVTSTTYLPETVDRLSPSGMPVAHVAFAHGNGLAAGGDSLWAVSKEGTVARIDTRTARIVHRWSRLAPSGNADATEAIVADSRGAWLLSAGQGRILRLEGDRVTRVLQVDDTVPPILARSGRGLWIVTSDEPGRAGLARIDPRSGHITATVRLGDHYPRALVPVPGGLWVIAGDGTVVLVAG